MSRTITAMFDSRSEAEAAREQLRTTLGADARIIDKSNGNDSSQATGESRGFWAGIKDAFIPDEDRFSYEEGVNRGGFLLCAKVPENQADQACSILDQSNSVDFEGREQQWRSEGWAGYQRQPGTDAQADRGNVVDEQRIPVVEEQLRVGKREVERGGARVRSYVEERPVSETVNLREEHVNVERRPVDQPLSSADLQDKDLLSERTIEMRETAETPVVSKEARVTEEVVVQKTATDRTEQVQDTVRNTNVEVEQPRSDGDRSALGFDQQREPSREFDKKPTESR